jgi:hypothetical protein
VKGVPAQATARIYQITTTRCEPACARYGKGIASAAANLQARGRENEGHDRCFAG